MNRTPADTTEHAAHSWGKHGICTHCGTSPEMAAVFPRCLPFGWEGDAATKRMLADGGSPGWREFWGRYDPALRPRQLTMAFEREEVA